MLTSRGAKISLRLSLLVVMIFFLVSFQSRPLTTVKAAWSDGCNDACFERCRDTYFQCINDGGGYENCCAGGNFCAHSCGDTPDDCPLFCYEP